MDYTNLFRTSLLNPLIKQVYGFISPVPRPDTKTELVWGIAYALAVCAAIEVARGAAYRRHRDRDRVDTPLDHLRAEEMAARNRVNAMLEQLKVNVEELKLRAREAPGAPGTPDTSAGASAHDNPSANSNPTPTNRSISPTRKFSVALALADIFDCNHDPEAAQKIRDDIIEELGEDVVNVDLERVPRILAEHILNNSIADMVEGFGYEFDANDIGGDNDLWDYVYAAKKAKNKPRWWEEPESSRIFPVGDAPVEGDRVDDAMADGDEIFEDYTEIDPADAVSMPSTEGNLSETVSDGGVTIELSSSDEGSFESSFDEGFSGSSSDEGSSEDDDAALESVADILDVLDPSYLQDDPIQDPSTSVGYKALDDSSFSSPTKDKASAEHFDQAEQSDDEYVKIQAPKTKATQTVIQDGETGPETLAAVEAVPQIADLGNIADASVRDDLNEYGSDDVDSLYEDGLIDHAPIGFDSPTEDAESEDGQVDRDNDSVDGWLSPSGVSEIAPASSSPPSPTSPLSATFLASSTDSSNGEPTDIEDSQGLSIGFSDPFSDDEPPSVYSGYASPASQEDGSGNDADTEVKSDAGSDLVLKAEELQGDDGNEDMTTTAPTGKDIAAQMEEAMGSFIGDSPAAPSTPSITRSTELPAQAPVSPSASPYKTSDKTEEEKEKDEKWTLVPKYYDMPPRRGARQAAKEKEGEKEVQGLLGDDSGEEWEEVSL
jgi:hypothetical protein